MTLDEYNETVKQIFKEQQSISESAAQLALSGGANPLNPQFGELMTRQWSLMQQLAQLNSEMMLGIMAPKS